MLVVRIATVVVLAALAAAPALARDPNPPTLQSNQGCWKITRQWNMDEVRHYAKWIEHMYVAKVNGDAEQRMAKIDHILNDPEMNLLLDPAFLGQGSNPQLPANVIRSAHNILDCAKLVYFLPAYYAYRRGLPWMVTFVASGGGDIRTAHNNTPTGTASNFNTSSLATFFSNATAGISTGNFRVQPYGRNWHLSDTVPVAIDPEYLLPGCPMYLDGHSLILAKVTDYGELYFLNASTTPSRDIYTYNGMNVVTGITPKGAQDPDDPWAGCFHGLRTFRYPIAETDGSGRVTNVRRRTDDEMKAFGFSLEQYTLMRELQDHQRIEVDGLRPSNLHDFIRLRMKRVDTINPLRFMERYADEIIEVYERREDFVQDAWANYKRNGPITYPENRANENIFQAHGRWETWSSPSSDVDRRNKYFYLIEWVDYAIRWFGLSPEFVDLAGLEHHTIRSQKDLLEALIKEKERIFENRSLQYTNSKGEKVRLTLADIEERLYDLSFDPNHPPELRWGAREGTEEYATAPQTHTPVPGGARIPMEEAYRLQYYYRTVGERETEMSMLRGMFTEGFGIRDRFEDQLRAMWRYYDEPTPEIVAHLRNSGHMPRETPPPPPPPLVVPGTTIESGEAAVESSAPRTSAAPAHRVESRRAPHYGAPNRRVR